MAGRSVLSTCPEGGNWPPHRWTASIERLEARGMRDRADEVGGGLTIRSGASDGTTVQAWLPAADHG